MENEIVQRIIEEQTAKDKDIMERKKVINICKKIKQKVETKETNNVEMKELLLLTFEIDMTPTLLVESDFCSVLWKLKQNTSGAVFKLAATILRDWEELVDEVAKSEPTKNGKQALVEGETQEK